VSTNKAIGNAHYGPSATTHPHLSSFLFNNAGKPPLKRVAELRKLAEVSITNSREALAASNNGLSAALNWLQDDLAVSGAKKSHQDRALHCGRRSRRRVLPLARDGLIPWWRLRRPRRTQLPLRESRQTLWYAMYSSDVSSQTWRIPPRFLRNLARARGEDVHSSYSVSRGVGEDLLLRKTIGARLAVGAMSSSWTYQ
jgi:hypothetical protein